MDGGNIALTHGSAARVIQWETVLLQRVGSRNWLVMNVPTSQYRAQLLSLGYGDAVGNDCCADEISARLHRLDDGRKNTVYQLTTGNLTLDAITRSARLPDAALALNPREFALLWELAVADGRPLAPDYLLKSVCNIGFDPGTNRIAVHICRLRAKLSAVGLKDAIKTDGADYRLNSSAFQPAIPMLRQSGLDEASMISNDAGAATAGYQYVAPAAL